MTRILIIGGKGFVGKHFMRCFQHMKDIEIHIGTRKVKAKNEVLISFDNPSEVYKTISNFHMVINTSKWPIDKRKISDVFNQILKKGGIWLETTADYEKCRAFIFSRTRT